MKKRFPALVLGGILALGLLSGCGQKEAASSVSTEVSEPGFKSPSVCRRNVCPEHFVRYSGKHYRRRI